MSRRKHTKWHFWDWNLLIFWGSIPIYPGFSEHLWGLFFQCVHLQNLTLHTWQWNNGHLQVMGSYPTEVNLFLPVVPTIPFSRVDTHFGSWAVCSTWIFDARVLKFSVLRNVKSCFNFDLSSVMKSSRRRRRPPLWYTNWSFPCF